MYGNSVDKLTEKEYKHQYYLKNKERQYQWNKEWRNTHPNEVKEMRRKQHLKHQKKRNEYGRIWRKNNPSWSQQVRQIHGKLCVICEQPCTHAHHIIHKKTYPGLAKNINNGVPLCLLHHQQTHGVNLV